MNIYCTLSPKSATLVKCQLEANEELENLLVKIDFIPMSLTLHFKKTRKTDDKERERVCVCVYLHAYLLESLTIV